MGKMLTRLIGMHIELTTTLATDLGQVKAEQSQIEQVIVNLAVQCPGCDAGGRQAADRNLEFRCELNGYGEQPSISSCEAESRSLPRPLVVKTLGPKMCRLSFRRLMPTPYPSPSRSRNGKGGGPRMKKWKAARYTRSLTSKFEVSINSFPLSGIASRAFTAQVYDDLFRFDFAPP